LNRAPVAALERRVHNNRKAQAAKGDLREIREIYLFFLLEDLQRMKIGIIRPVLQGP
jgi:hypothetical protein